MIAVVTLLTVTRTTYLPAASAGKKVAICLSVWVVPVITTIIAASQGAMGPVSGNWCWIMSTRTDLRYALTHGWRIAIIFCTTGIYIFVWWFMHRHFRSIVSTDGSTTTKGSWMSRRRGFKKMKNDPAAATEAEQQQTELSMMSKSRISRIGNDWELSAPEAAYIGDDDAHSDADEGRRHQQRGSLSDVSEDDEIDEEEEDERYGHGGRRARFAEQEHKHLEREAKGGGGGERPTFNDLRTTDSEFPTRRQTRNMEREIKRVLLLNAYPIMYVVLWIPGLTNRFMEATGHKSDSRVLAALQASSQFVGLANALTYGFNTALRTKCKRWWKAKKKAMGWVDKPKKRAKRTKRLAKISDGTPSTTPGTQYSPQMPYRPGTPGRPGRR